MADNEKITRELDHYKEDIDQLHSRTQEARSKITTHEAVCEERYQNIMQSLLRFEKRIDELRKEVAHLKTLAVQGKFTLKTTAFLGGLVSGIVAFTYYLINLIGKS